MFARTYQEIPIHLVDEPDAPTRQRISADSVTAMKQSLLEHGQLQPGGVVPNGDRFTISYGHRRYLGAVAAELPVYCAYVYQSDTAAMLGAQLAENADREDVNPVDEAFWFAQLIDAGVADTDELAQLLQRTRDYVEIRLNLLRGDPAVREALKAEQIGLGVAKLLNAYESDSDRLVLLEAARAGGASARLVAEWIADRKKIARALAGLPTVDPAAPGTVDDTPIPENLRCYFCTSDEQVYLLVPVWIHKTCKPMLDALLTRHFGGAHAVSSPPLAETRRP